MGKFKVDFLGQHEFVLFVPPIKSSKSELFISFNMEFKLKTSENHLKLS